MARWRLGYGGRLIVLALGLCLGIGVVPGFTQAPTPPPPVQVEKPPPSPGPQFVWIAGHWAWQGGRWAWVAGPLGRSAGRVDPRALSADAPGLGLRGGPLEEVSARAGGGQNSGAAARIAASSSGPG